MADRVRSLAAFGQGGAPHPAVLRMALVAMGCDVSIGACEALVQMGPEPAGRMLRAMFPDFDERLFAAQAVMNGGVPEARP